MRTTTLLNKLLQLPGLWVQAIRFEDDTLIIEGPIRRLRCPQCCTVRTEAVPWARHRSAFTRSFEDAVGLLAQKLDHTGVAALTDVAWVTVGSIAERLVGEHLHEDRFDELSDEQLDSIELVSIDMSAAYIKALEQYLPDATIVFDPFHVARLTQIAVDEVRPRPDASPGPRRQPLPQAHPLAVAKATRTPRYRREGQAQPRATRQQRHVPRLPAEGDLPRHLRLQEPMARPACHGSLNRLGTTVPSETLRSSRPHRPQAPRRHPCLHRLSADQRPPRGHEQQDPPAVPSRLRLPLRRPPHRHRLPRLLQDHPAGITAQTSYSC